MTDVRPNYCEAVQISDQLSCHRCGLLWDTNDPEPPECPRLPPGQARHEALTNINRMLCDGRQRVE